MTIPILDEDDEENIVSSRPLAFLAEALQHPLPWDATILTVAMYAPLESLSKVLRLVPRETGFLFHSPQGMQIAGGGTTAVIRGEGPERFKELSEGADELWSRIVIRNADGLRHVPLVVGAGSFLGTPAREAPWTSFDGNAFILPRWMYSRDGFSGRLVCSITREELETPGAVDKILREASGILLQLDRDSPTSLIHRQQIPSSAVHELSADAWRAYIADVQAAIATGGFEKIVAARRTIIDLSGRTDDTAVMARLFAGYPECTHFAVRRGDATFFGATPETLFRKTGRRIYTEALAGTVRVSDDAWTDDASGSLAQLHASTKDRAEHAVVVRAIDLSLSPLTLKTEHAEFPEARRVRHLLHLRTPITGELRDGVSAFDLVSALHPTPAIGGFPMKPAAAWIGEHEEMERGLYCGTTGWFDANGDAEIAVSIRCGVLMDDRAYVYAGAGIVADSVADSEYNETAAKMIPFLRAIGASV